MMICLQAWNKLSVSVTSRRILARSTMNDAFLAEQLQESRRTKGKRHTSGLRLRLYDNVSDY